MRSYSSVVKAGQLAKETCLVQGIWHLKVFDHLFNALSLFEICVIIDVVLPTVSPIQSLLDLPGGMETVCNGPGKNLLADSGNDVVCCVKRYAADEQLSQDLVIVIACGGLWLRLNFTTGIRF